MDKTTIILTILVTVDTEAWEETYGSYLPISLSPQQGMAADVTSYVLNQLNQSAAAEECGMSVVRLG